MRMSNFRRGLAAGVVGIGLLLGGQALAETAQERQARLGVFPGCDGYGAPSGSGDGMSMQAMTWGIFVPDPGYGTTLQGKVRLSSAGVAACDGALASPMLLPKFWQRRVSLMRAKAVHLLAVGRTAEAKAQLDAAEAAATGSDPFYQRGLGLGFGFLRAYMLREAGDNAGAAKLAIETWRKRPYDRSAAISAIIAMGADADPKDVETVLKSMAVIFPDLIEIYFIDLYEKGRFAEAVTLYNEIKPSGTGSNFAFMVDWYGGYGAYGGGLAEMMRERHDREDSAVRNAGAQAYMLAALGRTDEARAVLKAARDRLAASTAPLPPTPLRRDGRPKVQPARPAIERANRQLATLGRILDAWAVYVDHRIALGVDRNAAADFLKGGDIPANRAGLDLLDTALAGNIDAPTKARAQADRDRLYKRITSDYRLREKSRTTLSQLFATLPDAESLGRLESYKKPKPKKPKGVFNDPPVGSFVFNYWGFESSPSMAQEAVLLQAAEYARSVGRKGFVILRRSDVQRMTQTMMYGTAVGAPQLTGYESTILIMAIDPEALPAELAGMPWRFIDAEAVYAALYPVYGPKPKTKR